MDAKYCDHPAERMTRRQQAGLRLLSIILLCGVLLVVHHTAYAQVNVKLDPSLHNALLQQKATGGLQGSPVEVYASGERLTPSAGASIAVLVKGTGDVPALVRGAGGVVNSRHGDIVSAIVPLDQLSVLAANPRIAYIEASRPLFSSLDLSVARTGADALHAQIDPQHKLTGKGVIIGFTDSGINTGHPTFRTADGRTRILYVWDQYSGGTPPAGFSYGAEYDSSQINSGAWSMVDGGQHGTHVAGTAAGSGLPLQQYVGMAPEADIIMVANAGNDLFDRGQTTVGTLDGYDYIRAKAQALGKRFVINTSQGTNLGPHDGKTLFEQAVNADVTAGSINCISGGNEASSQRHASGVVPSGGSIEIPYYFMTFGPTDISAIPMEVWYETNDRFQIELRDDNGGTYSAPVVPGSSQTLDFDSVSVLVTSILGSPLNGDNQIAITVTPKVPIYPSTYIYRMTLRVSPSGGNGLPDGGRVDLWWERNYNVAFAGYISQAGTVGMPACADSAITVASYTNRTTAGTVGAISYFSGIGPRRDGAIKPDIAAPGGAIISSLPGGSYGSMSGTSMSSPHVTGAVALLLQQHPTWTNAQVKYRLLSTASSDAYTGAVPNAVWGAGKLNVAAAAGFTANIPAAPVLISAVQSGASVILQWTDPAAHLDGSALTDLARVYVYRAGVLIDSVAPGVQAYVDPSPGSNTHRYVLNARSASNWFSGKSNVQTVTLFLPTNSWLLVDDDIGQTYEQYHAEALTGCGVAFDTWTVALSGAPSAGVLSQYVGPNAGVIWFTGYDAGTTLTSDDQTALTAYLNAGGNLFINGQDIGYDLYERGSTADQQFFATYLKATYVQDDVNLYGLIGQPGTLTEGINVRIAGGTGANNQVYPSEITPIAPAFSVFQYDPSALSGVPDPAQVAEKPGEAGRDVTQGIIGSGSGGIAYANGDGRVVLFCFGFEAIDTRDSRIATMQRVLAYLSPGALAAWSDTVRVSDGCGGSAKLRFGQSAKASDDIDAVLGEEERPPLPPTGVFDARLVSPLTGLASMIDYRNDSLTTVTWHVDFQPGMCGYPVTLRWNPRLLPAGDVRLRDRINGQLVNVNMRSDSVYVLNNAGIASLAIQLVPASCRTIPVAAGWGLVSVPVIPPDSSAASIFPSATSPVFGYRGKYETAASLTQGKGYWVKHAAAQSIVICGDTVAPRGIALDAGWNMIGPFHRDINTAAITTVPAGIVASQYFGFAGSYAPSTILSVGSGYWVKASGAGTLNVASGTPKAGAIVGGIAESWPKIRLTDAAGTSSELHLAPRAEFGMGYEMPPLPPDGLFDIRFTNHAAVDTLEAAMHRVMIQGVQPPLTVSLIRGLGRSFRVAAYPGEGNSGVVLSEDGQVVFRNAPSLLLITVDAKTAGVPTDFFLDQNYPNPFNPGTLLRFGLPVNAHVRLLIFDVLGRQVSQLVDEDRSAGFHEVAFDGTSLASGLYICRMEAGSFIATQKLLLVK
jgi:subtilisin family serine protease